MEKKEFENWAKVRAKGMKNYVIKTTLIGYFSVFAIYVFTNGYIYRDKLEKYINYNLGQWEKLTVTSVISIIALGFLSWYFWKFTEKRYEETLKESK